MKYYCIVANFICWSAVANAQQNNVDSLPEAATAKVVYDEGYSTPFIIGNITIEGNKKTKPYIVKRELPFKEGDSIYLPELVRGFEVSRQQLMNTTLFNEVVIALKSFRGYHVDIIIQVKERWYIFPLPYFKPVDRNLSEWARQGYSLDRINYGFKFNYNNFTGRNDKLKIWLITGYTRQIQFQYDQPYADKSLKHGYGVGFTYAFNREINFKTTDNQQLFVDTFSAGIKQWTGHLDYTYRPGLRTYNAVRLGYTRIEVDTGVLDLNPKYFNNGKNVISYPELSYTLNYYKVDYIPYPLTGWMGEVSISKRGIHADMNLWQLRGKFTRAWQLSKKYYFNWQANAVLRVPFEQPFINQRLFGYGDMYLRGLEKYVIDGVAGFLSRQTFRRELFRFNVPTYLKSKSHDRIPFRIYARTFADIGYTYSKFNTGNSLANRMLYTAGFGLDVISFYDFVLRLDFSFNQLGQNGLFLHIKNDL